MTEHSEQLLARLLRNWLPGEHARCGTYERRNPDGSEAVALLEASDTALTEALARVKVLEDALDPFALLAGDSVNMNDPLHKWFTVAQLAQARVARNKERGDA